MTSSLFRIGLLVIAACAVVAPACTRAPGTEVTFRTRDGFLLEGTVFGSGDKGVVLAHMRGSNQTSWAPYARELTRDGYLVLTFNFRGYGRSEGSRQSALLGRDVVAAATFLREKRGIEKPALVGASMGGTAALVAAQDNDISGVVTLSAPANFEGLDALSVVGSLTMPKLLLASNEDEAASTSAEELYKAASPPRQIEILAGSTHGTDMLSGREGKQAKRLIQTFLEGSEG